MRIKRYFFYIFFFPSYFVVREHFTFFLFPSYFVVREPPRILWHMNRTHPHTNMQLPGSNSSPMAHIPERNRISSTVWAAHSYIPTFGTSGCGRTNIFCRLSISLIKVCMTLGSSWLILLPRSTTSI